MKSQWKLPGELDLIPNNGVPDTIIQSGRSFMFERYTILQESPGIDLTL